MAILATEEKVDFSKDVATLLRTGTAAAHDKAENSEGAGWLVRGELDREEYVRFLMMLYHVYEHLETALEKYSTHPVLAPTYNPTLFARTAALSSDISHFLQLPESSWLSHPIHTSLEASPPEAFTAYTARIRYLADTNPAGLLAHAYVRYLGDLSGGQFIKRRIIKAYNLDDDDDNHSGRGVAFYEFGKLGGEAGVATIGDIKKVKEWFRKGMCEGVGEDEACKAMILDEANVAFELNTGLFTTLRPPSRLPSSSVTPDIPFLGDPTSPVVSPTPSPAPIFVTPGPSPLQLLEKSKEDSPVEEKGTIPFSSFIAFILALCVAHFALTTGGFTGDSGWAKLESLFQWMTSTLFGATPSPSSSSQ
ncbi:heme oxygenase [Cytidiella melzeri]|nr:heme oxygenase [Cytidiella melzeri]